MPCLGICDSSGRCSTTCWDSNPYPSSSGGGDWSSNGSGGSRDSYDSCMRGFDSDTKIITKVGTDIFRQSNLSTKLTPNAYGKIYCNLDPVPQAKLIWGGSPFKYTYSGNDSDLTRSLKSAYNNLVDQAFDGTKGFTHWSEGLIQGYTEKNLREKVEKSCLSDYNKMIQKAYPVVYDYGT